MSSNSPTNVFQRFALRKIGHYQRSALRQKLMRSPEPVCKFDVSCSVYATRVIVARGFFVGVALTVLRLLVCCFSPRGRHWSGCLSGDDLEDA
jgi:putative component of membrane protein insertase Oxa1/YidC/SpoIIIJ protein YidD